MNNFLKINHRVNFAEVDHKSNMRLDYVISNIQKVTGFHSTEMGVDGHTTAEKCNAYWVVSKIKLKIFSLPQDGEEVEIETWPTTVTPLRFLRDYKISLDGKECIVATSEWCTLDIDTMRPRRTDSICYPFDMEHRKDRSGAGEFSKPIENVTEEHFNHEHKSLFIDIDSNGHTNNVVYARMTLNCFTPEEFDNINLDEFEIYFLSQTFYGDAVRVYKKKTDYGYYIEGKKEGKTTFSCVLKTK
ncbi:MAG: hypothetical protein IKB98_09255 [Clostridia bacterium]|nr:hypothetical protein [Clostridia bacterium]